MKHLDYSAPGEREAGERTWEIVRAAFEERLPSPRKRDWRPFALAATAAVVLAAAFSPPGNAVFHSLRDAVRGEQNAKPALASLPAPGRLRNPRWSFDGFRIAYFAGRSLRVVNGDGTGDRLLTRDVRPGPAAWQPNAHTLAYVNRAGDIEITNVDKRNRSATVQTRAAPRQLAWASDGKTFIAVEPHAVEVFSKRGPRLGSLDRGIAQVSAAAISPNGKRIAFVETRGGRSTLQLTGVPRGPTGPIFEGAGTFANIDWSPDGRWLLLDWSSADQWLFIHSPVQKVLAVSNIRANFGADSRIAGWCCP